MHPGTAEAAVSQTPSVTVVYKRHVKEQRIQGQQTLL